MNYIRINLFIVIIWLLLGCKVIKNKNADEIQIKKYYETRFMAKCWEYCHNDTLWNDGVCDLANNTVYDFDDLKKIDSLAKGVQVQLFKMATEIGIDNEIKGVFVQPSNYCIANYCLKKYHSKELEIISKNAILKMRKKKVN